MGELQPVVDSAKDSAVSPTNLWVSHRVVPLDAMVMEPVCSARWAIDSWQVRSYWTCSNSAAPVVKYSLRLPAGWTDGERTLERLMSFRNYGNQLLQVPSTWNAQKLLLNADRPCDGMTVINERNTIQRSVPSHVCLTTVICLEAVQSPSIIILQTFGNFVHYLDGSTTLDLF